LRGSNRVMKRLLATVVVCVLAGCGPKAPPLELPDSVQSYCSDKEPRGTAIDSILASVADKIETGVPFPGMTTLRKDIRQNSGVIGHWNAQPLYLPKTAKALGVAGDYIDVTSVVIDNPPLAGIESRLIYVTVASPSGPKNLVLRAYDVANVCVEGERLS
jgi:predicted small lipoprotein YifL